MAANRLIIFLKAPRRGEVKTRLAKSLGDAGATAAYRQMVDHLVKELAPLRHVELCFTPDDSMAEIQSWSQPGWQLRPQGSGDLGVRLQNAFADSFAQGDDQCVIIGSDCPEVLASDIREAWRELSDHDLVVGPATDGGYWLIGLRQLQAELFESIPWSTDRVLAATMQRAKALKLRIQLLRILTDVDTAKEWREYLARQKMD